MSVLAAENVKLLPVEPVLGAPQNASHAEVQIVLRKNMFDWGTDYAVRDLAGNVVVVANAKPDSTLDKKQILDPKGNELYEIRDEIMSVSHGMVGHKSGGNIFEAHNHKTHMGKDTTTELRGWWKDNNGKHDIVLSGDWYKGTAVLWLPKTNQGIGKVLMQPVNLDSNWDKEEYVVTVAPGVDVQVFAGLIIAFEAVLAKELQKDVLFPDRRPKDSSS